MAKKIETQLKEELASYNHTKEVFSNLASRLEARFLGKKEYSDEDIEIINIFKDIIQAKTFKYVTPEKARRYSSFNISSYISRECSDNKTINQRLNFSLIRQRMNKFKNDPVRAHIYNSQNNTGDDYY